jgi:hypothetical protein
MTWPRGSSGLPFLDLPIARESLALGEGVVSFWWWCAAQRFHSGNRLAFSALPPTSPKAGMGGG